MSTPDAFDEYLRSRGHALPPAAPMARPKVDKETGDAQVSTAKGVNAPRREHAEAVGAELTAEEKALRNKVAAATSDAQIKEANAKADRAEAEAEAARRANRYGGLPPEKVAEFKGNTVGLAATRKKLDDLRAQYLTHFRGKGPLRSTSEMLPSRLRPANGVFDDSAGALLTTAAQTQGLTSRQFDTPKEQAMFLAPLIPKSTDNDEQIEHKLAQWDDMVGGASKRYGVMLGIPADALHELEGSSVSSNLPSPGLRWLTDEQEQAVNAFANGPHPTAQGYADLMERLARENGRGFDRDEALRVGATIEARRASGRGFGAGVAYVNHSPVPTEGDQTSTTDQSPGAAIGANVGDLLSQPANGTAPAAPQQATQPPTGGMLDFLKPVSDAITSTNPASIIVNPTAGAALSNLPSSTAKFVGDTASGLSDVLSRSAPLGVDTRMIVPGVPDQIPAMMLELGNSALGALGVTGADPRMAQAVGKLYADRYGGVDAARHTFETDPVGFLADASTLLTGVGGAGVKGAQLAGTVARTGRVAGAVGDAARATQIAGRMLDPVSLAGLGVEQTGSLAARYVPQGVKDTSATALQHLTQKYPAAVLATPSGIGGETVEEAVGAGRQRSLQGPNPRSAAFTGQMRDTRPASDIVEELDKGVQQLREAASTRYQRDIAPITRDATQLDFNPVLQDLQNMRPRTQGWYKGRAAGNEAAWAHVNDLAEQHAALIAQDPAKYATPDALDAFKQRLYDTASQFAEGSDASAARIANKAYRSVKTVIEKQAPDYAKVMRDYATAQEHLGQIKGTLTSGGQSRKVDATVRRLQSILRRNDPGHAGQLIEDVNAQPQSELRASIAGRDAAPILPDRWRTGIAAGTALGTGVASLPFEGLSKLEVLEPSQLAALALFSPRATSEMAYGLGRLGGAGEQGAKAAWGLYNDHPSFGLAGANAARTASALAEEDRKRALLKRYQLLSDADQSLVDKYARGQ